MHLDQIKQPNKVYEMYMNRLISKSAHLIYLALFYVNNRMRHPTVFQLSHPKLAKMSRLNIKTVRRGIWELQRAGLIKFFLGSGRTETTYLLPDIIGEGNTMLDKPTAPVPENVKEILTNKIWSYEWFRALREKLRTYRNPKGVRCKFDEFGTIEEDANYIKGVGRAIYLEIAQIDYRASIA